MKNDEIYIKELFQKIFNLKFEKIQESHNKTPDFYVKYEEFIIAISELKTFINEVPSKDNGWVETEYGIMEKISEDNGPARVARKIKEGYVQLERYNYPKILILLNKDPLLDHIDLEEC